MLQRCVDRRSGDGAMGDIDHKMAAASVEAHDQTRLGLPTLELHPAAIAPFLGGLRQRENKIWRNIRLTDQGVAEDLLLPARLFTIVQMLPLTAAAAAEERTGRRPPPGTRLQQGDQLPFGIAFLFANDATIDQIARRGAGDEDRLALMTANAGAAVGETLNA